MKNTLLATTALVLVAATASAVDVEMYGQVNKGFFGYNDGQDTNMVVVDNANSSTRMGLKGAQALDNGLTASVLFEGQLVDNSSDAFTQAAAANTGVSSTTPASSSAGTFTSRQARVGLSGNFGGVYLGKQSVATDGVMATDLAGAADVMGQDVAEIGGGLAIRAKAAGKALGTTINALTNNNTSFGDQQANSLRYDSPIFAGVQARASVQQGGDLDLAAFYDGAMGDFKMAASAGVQFNNDAATASTAANVKDYDAGASVSVAHKTGLAATVAYQTESLSNKSAGASEAEGWYAKAGYAWDAFEVAADYSTNEHFASKTNNKDGLKAMGLAAQYNLGNGVSVAGLYRNFDADLSTGAAASTKFDTESVDLYGVNMRVKF